MNKSRYKLYKKGKKWVITAVAATSIGIGSYGYVLTDPNLVHADSRQLSNIEPQPVLDDSELYKMADELSNASKKDTIVALDSNSASSNYESFKAALSVYEIAKYTNSTVYNDLSIISSYNTGIPAYITDNQLQLLNSKFKELYSAVADTYYHHDNNRALNVATSYINQASSVVNFHKNRIFEPIGSLASKDDSLVSSASDAIANAIGSYNAMKSGSRYPESSFASNNVSTSKPNVEMNRKNDVNRELTVALSSSTDVTASTATSSAASSASSAIDSLAVSSAATSYSSSASSAYTPTASFSSTNKSNNSSKKSSNDMYKKLYLELKKKAAKDISSNRYKVAKYKKEYKVTKNKQQKAKKLKQYRDAKNKLNASKKYFKDLNYKLLKY